MCPLFLTVSHKYAISFDNDVLISSANIPAELHVVVCLFTRPSFLFSLSNFPTGRGRGGSGDETRQVPLHFCNFAVKSQTGDRG